MSRRLRNLLFAFSASAALWSGIIYSASQAFGAEGGARPFYYTKVFPHPIKSTEVSTALLEQVNLGVNEAITFRRDKTDEWKISPRFGDCEDYALTKLVRLHAAGVPLSSLRLARGWARGERHMVLLVYRKQGVVRLDNLLSGLGSARGFTPITRKFNEPQG